MMQTYFPPLRSVRRDVTMCSRTLAIGGKKKLGIHRKLQTICLLLAILLRLSKNVNHGRDITGVLL